MEVSSLSNRSKTIFLNAQMKVEYGSRRRSSGEAASLGLGLCRDWSWTRWFLWIPSNLGCSGILWFLSELLTQPGYKGTTQKRGAEIDLIPEDTTHDIPGTGPVPLHPFIPGKEPSTNLGAAAPGSQGFLESQEMKISLLATTISCH